jgi:hypothetical protein
MSSVINTKHINNIDMDRSKYKHIVVTASNYHKLKQLGAAGDSFNDVINYLLENKKSLGNLPSPTNDQQTPGHTDGKGSAYLDE